MYCRHSWGQHFSCWCCFGAASVIPAFVLLMLLHCCSNYCLLLVQLQFSCLFCFGCSNSCLGAASVAAVLLHLNFCPPTLSSGALHTNSLLKRTNLSDYFALQPSPLYLHIMSRLSSTDGAVKEKHLKSIFFPSPFPISRDYLSFISAHDCS